MTYYVLLAAWLHAALGQVQWRVVHPGNQITSGWGVSALSAEAAKSPVRSVWLWSFRHAPVGGVPEAASGAARELKGDGPFWLEVQVPRRPGAAGRRGISVVAAPLEMWRELPEGELPRWPLPSSGRIQVPVDGRHGWRVRLVSDGEGSWWADVPAGQRSVELGAVPAPGIRVTVLQPDGKPAAKVHAAITEPTVRQGASRTWALLADKDGQLTAAALPDAREITLSVIAGGFSPLAIRGWPSRLPRQIVLRPGAEVLGKVTDANRRGIAGASVEAETWTPGTARLLRLVDKTKADGSFALRAVPPGRLNLTLRAKGYVPTVEPLEMAAGERRDLGIRVLETGQPLEIAVRDEHGQPVPGANVEAGPGLRATSDSAGKAVFAGVPAAPMELRGTAFGHLPGTRRLQPPIPPRATLELRRGFTIRGRLLDTAGTPVSSGTVQLEAANCSSDGVLRADGTFEEEFQPGKEGQVVLRSPQTRELRVPLAPGAAGETRDLGDLKAPAGLEVTGAIAGGRDASPVAGARVWLPRPGPQGPTMAWAANDFVEATSGEDGRFHLLGLAAGPATLRIDAPGYARVSLEVQVPEPGPDPQPLDLGTIHLGEGSVVRVHVDPSRLGADGMSDLVAQIDVRRHWLAADMLSAQVWNGEADVPNVPAGAARVSVVAGGKILCEQEIDVSGGGEMDVDCVPGGLLVTGRVLTGGVAAGPGALVWHSSEDEGWSRVDNEVSPSGLRRQQTFVAGRPQVDVMVELDGTFQTRDLAPGRWRVSFQPQRGSATPELALEIPAGERFDAVLPFDGFNLAGIVVNKDGSPAPGALVRELTSGGVAIAREDGGFLLTGLRPGKLSLQARQDELTSAVSTVELSADEPSPAVRLIVQKDDPPQVAVTVVDRSGSPAPGAMVLFEEEGKGMRLLVTGSDGRTLAGIEAPLPPRVRAAAVVSGSLALGDWTGLEAAGQGVTLPIGVTGGLEVRSAGTKGVVQVVSAAGWNVSWILRLLGVSSEITPAQPLRLEGLPPGSYTVTLGSATATASVGEGRQGDITFQ